MKDKYQKTIYACFIGYVVQAVVNNFVPLLFLTFEKTYGIPLSKITMLITLNFGVQLIVDLLSAGFVDKIGYRVSIVIAHAASALGLIGLVVLPNLFPDAYTGILLSVMIYAIGGGLIEVLISPIMESCPTDNKEKAMSLLHSFYCWGHVGVVLLSTLFFAVFGIENWKILALLWALVPLCNLLLFATAPICTLNEEGEKGMSLSGLLTSKIFWILMLLMVCSGACEQAVSQWASTFAEKGLGISKTAGDLAGPMMFALLMGTSRLLYGKWGEKMNLQKCMAYSGILCAVSYLLISLSPSPVLSLIGCGICGFSVGILWPGTFSMAAKQLRSGGTVLFALLALAGDLGCTGGPTYVGLISGAFGDDLKAGILAALIFPALLLVGLPLCRAKTPSVPD